MRSIGFAFAAAAAIGNSCIDGSRKFASLRFTATELIGLVGLLDAILLVVIVAVSGNSQSLDTFLVVSNREFLLIVVISAGIKVIAGFLYQRALCLSPLSVTVPYLAFTPVLLVFTSFIMMHEEPSYQGLTGVVIVTVGGYLLAIEQPVDGETKRERLNSNSWYRLCASPSSVLSRLLSTFWKGKDRSLKLGDQVKEEEQIENGTLKLSVKALGDSSVKGPYQKREWNLLQRVIEPFVALRREQGSLLMLGVAGLLSVSSSLDKMGAHLAPSPIAFAAVQKLIMAIPVSVFLGLNSPSSFKHLFGQIHVLLSISIFEVVAFFCYLKSVESLLVAYSIAAKRSNVLITVFVGKLVFKENISRRLPFIVLMVGGMALIILA